MDIEVQNVVQMVLDNSSNCVAVDIILKMNFLTSHRLHVLHITLRCLSKMFIRLFQKDFIFETTRSMVRFAKKRPKSLASFWPRALLSFSRLLLQDLFPCSRLSRETIQVSPNLMGTIACQEWLTWNERESSKAFAYRRNIMDES